MNWILAPIGFIVLYFVIRYFVNLADTEQTSIKEYDEDDY